MVKMSHKNLGKSGEVDHGASMWIERSKEFTFRRYRPGNTRGYISHHARHQPMHFLRVHSRHKPMDRCLPSEVVWPVVGHT